MRDGDRGVATGTQPTTKRRATAGAGSRADAARLQRAVAKHLANGRPELAAAALDDHYGDRLRADLARRLRRQPRVVAAVSTEVLTRAITDYAEKGERGLAQWLDHIYRQVLPRHLAAAAFRQNLIRTVTSNAADPSAFIGVVEILRDTTTTELDNALRSRKLTNRRREVLDKYRTSAADAAAEPFTAAVWEAINRLVLLIMRSADESPARPLTDAQTELLGALATGQTYADIGQARTLSEGQVKRRVRNLASDLRIDMRMDSRRSLLVAEGIRAEIIEPHPNEVTELTDVLTQAQIEILARKVDGEISKGIAESLGISFSTVRHQERAIIDLLGAAHMAEAVAMTVRALDRHMANPVSNPGELYLRYAAWRTPGKPRRPLMRVADGIRDGAIEPHPRELASLTEKLTDRQIQILRHKARGDSRSDIAETLGITEHSIDTQMQKIVDRLGASNSAEAMAMTVRALDRHTANPVSNPGELYLRYAAGHTPGKPKRPLMRVADGIRNGAIEPHPRELTSLTEKLTDRQIQILRHKARGDSRSDIAETLGIVGHSVNTQMQNIVDRLGASNSAEAMAMTVRALDATARAANVDRTEAPDPPTGQPQNVPRGDRPRRDAMPPGRSEIDSVFDTAPGRVETDAAIGRTAAGNPWTVNRFGSDQPTGPGQPPKNGSGRGPSAQNRKQRRARASAPGRAVTPKQPEPSKRDFLPWIRGRAPKNKKLAGLYSGAAVNTIGTTMGSSFIPFALLEMGGDEKLVAFNAAVGALAALLAQLPAGYFGDRSPRSTVLKSTAAAAAIKFGAGAMVLNELPGALEATVLATGLGAYLDVMSGHSTTTFGRRLAENAEQERDSITLSLNERMAAGAVGNFLGPVLGGVSKAIPFMGDAASSLAYHAMFRKLPTVPENTERTRIFDGARDMWKVPYLRGRLGLLGFWTTGLTAASVQTPLFIHSADYGLLASGAMNAAYPAGLLAGGLVRKHVADRINPKWIFPTAQSAWLITMLQVAIATGDVTAINSLLLALSASSAGVAVMLNNRKFMEYTAAVVRRNAIGSSLTTTGIINGVAGIAGGTILAQILTAHGAATAAWADVGLFGAIAAASTGLIYATRNDRRIDDPLARVARVLHALGKDDARAPNHQERTWRTLQKSIGAKLVEYKPSPATAEGRDPVESIIDGLATASSADRATGEKEMDTAVVLIDYGNRIDPIIATTIAGEVFVYDPRIDPAVAYDEQKKLDRDRELRWRSAQEWKKFHRTITRGRTIARIDIARLTTGDDGELRDLTARVPRRKRGSAPRGAAIGPTRPTMIGETAWLLLRLLGDDTRTRSLGLALGLTADELSDLLHRLHGLVESDAEFHLTTDAIDTMGLTPAQLRRLTDLTADGPNELAPETLHAARERLAAAESQRAQGDNQ
ncbi:MFS transporter [Nocardia sp. NPDC052254]|uniref:MFS transporter n=1 Tax=Nocardia sp. NPDC052254 TaxID=3155681 RepID=UPI003436E514